jgi:UDP-N-acetylmuramyl tripeptide synthase
VTKIIAAQKAANELEKRTKMAEVRQREAEAAVTADRKRIERSRSILEAIVTDRCTASVKNEELHLTHIENGKAARTDKVSLADLESSVVYLARLHAKMLEGGERIGKLEQELRVERASLAQRYPDHAPVLAEEQKAVEQKIQRAFDPNQVPPNDVGF